MDIFVWNTHESSHQQNFFLLFEWTKSEEFEKFFLCEDESRNPFDCYKGIIHLDIALTPRDLSEIS